MSAGEIQTSKTGPELPYEAHCFARWEQDLASNLPERVTACRLEIRARLFRFAAEVANHRALSPCAQTPEDYGVAERIAQFINGNASEPLSASKIAQHFGLHPNSVMRIFKRAFNRTLVDYITEVRLFRAQRLLTTSNDLIEVIALEAGFGSMSRFNQAFRDRLGCSPREFRRNAIQRD